MEREPVVIWTTVGALIGALLVRFVPDLGGDAINAIVDAVVVLGPVIAGAMYARGKVTPVDAPRTKDGQPAYIVPRASMPTRMDED